MTRIEFLEAMRLALHGLKEEDIERYLDYYAEMIDDRVEDGMSEQDAVRLVCGLEESDPILEMSKIEEITAEILAEHNHAVKEQQSNHQKRVLKRWEIVLLVLGAPLWIPLLIAAASIVLAVAISVAAVIFSILVVVAVIYLVIWIVVLVFWICDLAFGIAAIGGLCCSIAMLCTGKIPQGLFLLGCSLACGGIKIAWMFGCRYATKYIWRFTKWTGRKLSERRVKRR